MKHTSRRAQQRPGIWRDFDYAALQDDAADSFADRASEEPFDAEDARMEVDIILRGRIRDLS